MIVEGDDFPLMARDIRGAINSEGIGFVVKRRGLRRRSQRMSSVLTEWCPLRYHKSFDH